MCPTNPQKDLKSRKGNESFSGTASEMEFLGSMGAKNPQATCSPKRVRAGGSAPQAIAILERSDHLEMAQDRLEECVWSPMGKVRDIQRLGGGDIPRLTSGQAVQELMVFSAGVNWV
jgi:hypothetical protein